MEQDNVVAFRRPDEPSGDPLTAVLRHGARALLAQAVEAEVAGYVRTRASKCNPCLGGAAGADQAASRMASTVVVLRSRSSLRRSAGTCWL
jgi:hypothetical protein